MDYAKSTDKQLRKQVKHMIENSWGLDASNVGSFTFVDDFRKCIKELDENINKLEKNDYVSIHGFLNTMDRYMEIMALNYSYSHLDNQYFAMKKTVNQTLDKFKENLEQSEIKKGYKSYPEEQGKADKATIQESINELVPGEPKTSQDNSRDFKI